MHGFIPGSVLGMILLFLCLFFKIIKPDNVKSVSVVLSKNMAVFFIPAGVGLMVYAEILSKSLFTILAAIAVSTVLTIVTVALIQDNFEKRRAKGGTK